VKYLSLFSGIGGFELGIQKAFKGKKQKAICVGYSEIDKHAIKIYETHFPNHRNFEDIKKINERKLPKFDLLVGGFPCQSFSIAGKRKGFTDKRGTLIFDIARILQAKKPRLFLLENVPGILSSYEGGDFKKIISEITKLGYSVQWQVLNSKYFSVAQNRQRLYLIGHRGKERPPKIFPLSPTDQNIARTNQAQSRPHIQSIYGGAFVGNKIYGVNGISPTILTRKNDIPIIAVSNSSSREFGWKKDQCPTLCAGDSKNRKIVSINGRIRRLTPEECEKLQGFSVGWTKNASDNQRYKCLGNAVTTNVIEAIIKKMFSANVQHSE
jgi:DNA (cytosine-5)-methyltransferase 1